MQISTWLIIAGVVLLLIGLLRKVKRLIWIGVIVAVIAAIATGVLSVPQIVALGLFN